MMRLHHILALSALASCAQAASAADFWIDNAANVPGYYSYAAVRTEGIYRLEQTAEPTTVPNNQAGATSVDADLSWYSYAKTGTDYVKSAASFMALDESSRSFQSTSISTFIAEFTPNATATVTINGLFRGSFGISDPWSLEDRTANLIQNNVNGGFTLGGGLRFKMSVIDVERDAARSVEISAAAGRYLQVFDGWIDTESPYYGDHVTTSQFDCFPSGGGCEVDSSRAIGREGEVDAGASFDYDFVAGKTYRLRMDLSCSVGAGWNGDASRTGPPLAGVAAACDASQSGYWNGITGAPDNLTLLADNGQDYRYSSSLSPRPLTTAVTAVPEPASWLMMLAGFAMVGTASRYRRRSATTTFA